MLSESPWPFTEPSLSALPRPKNFLAFDFSSELRDPVDGIVAIAVTPPDALDSEDSLGFATGAVPFSVIEAGTL